jgi:pyrimidine operon attenuation protein/uracil phosphoribosyltransferase
MNTVALPELESLFARLAAELDKHLRARNIAQPCLVGVQSGGVWVAERLRSALGIDTPCGTLDISFHRDDYGRAGLNPSVRPSQLPWDLAERHVVLVDDVLYTGRTVRAALNEIFDWGRPASVSLAVLLARDGRELPIEASAAGAHIQLPPGHHVKLRGPDPLRLELIDARS